MSFADPSPRHRARSTLPRLGLGRLAVYGAIGNAVGALAAFAATVAWLAAGGEPGGFDSGRAVASAAWFAAVTAAIGFAVLVVAVPLFAFALRHGRAAVLAVAAVLALLPAAIVFGHRYSAVVALAHGVAGAGVAALLVLRARRPARRAPGAPRR